MDLVVQKATELGVSAIMPVLTERTVVKLDARQSERKLAHWQGIAIAACEQSGRDTVPNIVAAQSLDELYAPSTPNPPACFSPRQAPNASTT